MGYNWARIRMNNNKNTETHNIEHIIKPRLLLLLFFITIFLSSCTTSKGLSVGDIRYLDLWCAQRLSNNEVLAGYVDHSNDNVVMVKIITCGEYYSEWESIQGYFTCVDHWTYETKEGDISTIPVFVKTSNYEKYKKEH